MLAKLKKIFSTSSTEAKPVTVEDLKARCETLRTELQELVSEKSPSFKSQWESWAEHPLKLDDKELATALESCLWAIYFIRLVEEAELNQWNGQWIAETLEHFQSEMDQLDLGCRIRYARGMLQEYAESGRRYGREARELYFGEWLWNCNAKNSTLQGQLHQLRALGRALLPEENRIVWLKR